MRISYFFFVFNPSLLWRQYCGSYLCQTQVDMVLPVVLYDRCSASNSLVVMQLIEGSNQMDDLLVLLDFHDCFPSQMIWACHWQSLILWTRSMIAFSCGLWVVTCSWFGFNAIIVTHLFELTFEFAHTSIVKDNKLRSRVTCQPGVMKQILDG
jgi:hypothetical protein